MNNKQFKDIYKKNVANFKPTYFVSLLMSISHYEINKRKSDKIFFFFSMTDFFEPDTQKNIQADIRKVSHCGFH